MMGMSRKLKNRRISQKMMNIWMRISNKRFQMRKMNKLEKLNKQREIEYDFYDLMNICDFIIIFIAANERKVEKEKNEKTQTQEKTKQKMICIPLSFTILFIHFPSISLPSNSLHLHLYSSLIFFPHLLFLLLFLCLHSKGT